jgi:hypothetical protein
LTPRRRKSSRYASAPAAQLVLQDYRALARVHALFFHDTLRILLRSNSRARFQDAVAEQNAENAAEAQFRCKRVRVVDGVDDYDIMMVLLVMKLYVEDDDADHCHNHNLIAVCVTLRFRAGGNDAIDGDTTEFGGSASR